MDRRSQLRKLRSVSDAMQETVRAAIEESKGR